MLGVRRKQGNEWGNSFFVASSIRMQRWMEKVFKVKSLVAERKFHARTTKKKKKIVDVVKKSGKIKKKNQFVTIQLFYLHNL